MYLIDPLRNRRLVLVGHVLACWIDGSVCNVVVATVALEASVIKVVIRSRQHTSTFNIC